MGSSGPGSVAQPWHADGVPLFPGSNNLPAHALNCFAPIVNVSRLMGPTQFVPGSHKPGPVARALEAALQRGREPADVFSPELSVGDVLVSIEAMKMETALHADRDGVIKEVHVKAGDQIDAKDLLVVYEG